MAAANPRDPHRTDRLVLAATAWSGNAGHGQPPVDRASAQDAARHRRRALAADRAMRADRGVRHREHLHLREIRIGHETAFEPRSEEHTSELQSLMRTSYAVFCLKKKKTSQHYRLTTV